MTRALLLDDDPWVLELLVYELQRAFPDLEIVTRDDPDATGEFDLYLIDNMFRGAPMAEQLVAQVRRARPEALIIAFAKDLSRSALKGIINAGCDGICEKGNPEDLAQLLEFVGRFLQRRSDAKQERPAGFRGTLNAVRTLLEQWNLRLEHEGRELKVEA
jgi:DNA-binding NarL/FixJ family response regulator